MERRIKISALLATIGLTVVLVSLLIHHPLSFVIFLSVGAVLVAIAIVYYLVSLVREPSPATILAPLSTGSSTREMAAEDTI
jgi:hypothetical protein